MQGKEFVSLMGSSKAGSVKALACRLQDALLPAGSRSRKKYFNAGLSAGTPVRLEGRGMLAPT
jgi:hypothetical protein